MTRLGVPKPGLGDRKPRLGVPKPGLGDRKPRLGRSPPQLISKWGGPAKKEHGVDHQIVSLKTTVFMGLHGISWKPFFIIAIGFLGYCVALASHGSL